VLAGAAMSGKKSVVARVPIENIDVSIEIGLETVPED